MAVTALVVLGLLNFLMILMTFRKYSTDGRSFALSPGSHQIAEAGGTSSAARGRRISRKAPVEPLVNSPFVEEESNGVNHPEKSGAGIGL